MKMDIRHNFELLVLLIGTIGCSLSKPHFRADDTQEFLARQILEWMDLNTDPCDDFYKHACGNRLAQNDTTQYFSNIFAAQKFFTYSKISDLLESHVEHLPSFKKAVTVFEACLDQDPEQNLKDLKEFIREHGGWPLADGPKWEEPGTTLDSLFPAMAKIARSRLALSHFNIMVMNNPYNTSKRVVTLFPPSADEFPLRYAGSFPVKAVLAMQLFELAKIVTEFGLKPDVNEAFEIVELNNHFHKSLGPGVETLQEYYTEISLEKLMAMIHINFEDYLNHLFEGIATFSKTDTILVADLPYFVQTAKILSSSSLRTIFNYEMMSALLPGVSESDIPKTARARTSIQLRPIPLELPRPKGIGPRKFLPSDRLQLRAQDIRDKRWFSCLDNTKSWLAYPVAKTYYNTYFSDNVQTYAKDTAEKIITVFKKRLQNIEWLDEPSRTVAEKKIANLKESYVFPDWVNDLAFLEKLYTPFKVSHRHMNNFVAANHFMRTTNFQLLSTADDPLTISINFDLPPLTVNAYYDPTENSINILAGILQFPAFDEKRKHAFNFAMVGMVIGHEITHGFDNTGQLFDEKGNVRDWMTPSVQQTFKDKGQCFVDQYNQYKLTSEDIPIYPDFEIQMNGERTLGENIADNGGIQQAFGAYKDWVKVNGKEDLPSILSEYTAEQTFFLSYAHMWCTKYYGTEIEVSSVGRDAHSPGKIRVIGSLSNFDEFSKAFNCKPNSNMNRGDESCVLW